MRAMRRRRRRGCHMSPAQVACAAASGAGIACSNACSTMQLNDGPARGGHPRRRAAADRGGRRHGQDHHARVAGRVAARPGRASRAHAAAHVQPTRSARDDLAGRAHRGSAATAGVDASRIWSGTFHAIGNRLLRLHGRALGLDPGFTVLDQSDAADVMNLLRDELGFSGQAATLPSQGDARRHLLANGQRRREARRRAEAPLPLVPRRGRRHQGDLRRVHRAQARAARARLRRPAAVLEGARDVAGHALAARRDVRPRAGRRVPGHERLAGRHPRGAQTRGHRAQPHGRRRRRAVDLRVPSGDGAQHPGVPRTLPGAQGRAARAELPVDAERCSRRRTP